MAAPTPSKASMTGSSENETHAGTNPVQKQTHKGTQMANELNKDEYGRGIHGKGAGLGGLEKLQSGGSGYRRPEPDRAAPSSVPPRNATQGSVEVKDRGVVGQDNKSGGNIAVGGSLSINVPRPNGR